MYLCYQDIKHKTRAKCHVEKKKEKQKSWETGVNELQQSITDSSNAFCMIKPKKQTGQVTNKQQADKLCETWWINSRWSENAVQVT